MYTRSTDGGVNIQFCAVLHISAFSFSGASTLPVGSLLRWTDAVLYGLQMLDALFSIIGFIGVTMVNWQRDVKN